MSFITNPAQFGPPPKPKVVPAGDIEGLTDLNGEPAKVFVRKLMVPQYKNYQASLQDDNGNTTKKTREDHQAKYVTETVTDAEGNPLWQSSDDAIAFFNSYPQSVLDTLWEAAIKINAFDSASVDRAEKNSG